MGESTLGNCYEARFDKFIETTNNVFKEHDRIITASYGHGFELDVDISDDDREVLRYIASAMRNGSKCVLSVDVADSLSMDRDEAYRSLKRLMRVNATRTFKDGDGNQILSEGYLLKGPSLNARTMDGARVYGLPIYENGGCADDVLDALEAWVENGGGE